MKWLSILVLLAMVPVNKASADVTLEQQTISLAGPPPNGWQTTYKVDAEANLAIDLGYMYEYENTQERFDLYKTGFKEDQELNLEALGTKTSRYAVKEPIVNFNINCYNAIGKLENEADGVFDDQAVHNYANTLITDLFDIEGDSDPVRGIEKEGVLILGAWLQIYHNLYTVLRRCTQHIESDDDSERASLMILDIDKSAALWIGRLQSHGDNTRGTMLYNLAERTAIHFNQDNGEAEVNTRFLAVLHEVRQVVDDGKCTSEGGTDASNIGYHELHKLFHQITGIMNIPVVQSIIHYIAIDADPKVIELYLLTIVPQLRACNTDYFEYLVTDVGLLASEQMTNDKLVELVKNIQYMYSCLGVTCEDIGVHTTGITCKEDTAEPRLTFAGYEAVNDVRNIAKFDRDVSQISILLKEKNDYSARELYLKGKNVLDEEDGFLTLQDLALHEDLSYSSTDETRIYKMYEEFYDNRTQFADDIVLEALLDKDNAEFSVPILFKAMVLPHYAIRSFFAAVDLCKDDLDLAEAFWDKGVAVLIGSIESAEVGYTGKGSLNGMSWFALNKEYCGYFNCANSIDATDIPPASYEMMKNIEMGRQAIEKADCAGLKKKVRAMESLLITPIIQGLLYHTALRELNGDDSSFGSSWAFAKAIMPVIHVRQKADVEVLGDTLKVPGDFQAKTLWSVIVLSLVEFGINCEHIGADTIGILSLGDSFCDFVSTYTEFPTASPVEGQPVAATRTPTAPPTAADAGDEINPTLISGYTFTNLYDSTKKAKIALDLRDFLNLRGHLDIEHDKALKIYENGVHSDTSIKNLSAKMKDQMALDSYFNFYRNAFRNDPLFAMIGDTETLADVYAHKIVEDALVAGTDVDLAYEAAVAMTMWMQVVHQLDQAVTQCGDSIAATDAGISIDTALAYYVGVSQTKAETDGHLLYNFAQKAANVFGTVEAVTGEANVNVEAIPLFKALKEQAGSCGGGPDETKTLRLLVGSRTDKASFYAILYGLATLPQLATCRPKEYFYLSNEITENGLDVANVDKLMDEFKKTYDCFGVSCTDIHGDDDSCQGYAQIPNTFAGFTPREDVTLDARIDRDVLKLNVLMEEGAWESAIAYYEHGHPAHTVDTPSLRSLARDPTWKQSPYYNIFESYHDEEMFADEIIMAALEGDLEPFGEYRRNIVMRSLQALVLTPAAIGYMYLSANDNECTFKHWDIGAAYLIGSVEGSQWGGDDRGNGVGLYGFAKELCNDFNVCTSSGDSEVNTRLVRYFKNGEDLISGGSCSNLKQFIELKLFPLVLVPLIQGAIEFAGYDEYKGESFVMAQALLPYVANVDTDSAKMIKDVLTWTTNVTEQVFIDAFANVLGDMKVNCLDVGALSGQEDLGLCKQSYDPEKATDLSDGLYITRTYVDDRVRIGLDVKDMTEKLNLNDMAGAKLIYETGWNSEIIDKDGKKVGYRNIASFSNNTAALMGEEPVYNLYRYTLNDVMGEKAESYGHNIVHQYFDSGIFGSHHQTLAAEAAVALNIWGFIVHELYETLDRCVNQGFAKDEDGIHSIDEAVAYWIGSDQETGSHTVGYLLYRLTEEAGEVFDIPKESGQSRTNRNVLTLFKHAALHLTFSDACSVGNNAVATLGVTIEKLVSQMTIPLIQHLIYNLKKNDRKRVNIYAHAVLPLLAPCAANTFEFLKKKLLSETYDVSEVDKIILDLQSTYSCLGLKCRDIGRLREMTMPLCTDRVELNPLAGYTPTTDVREYSDLDIDIRYIDIMMQQGAFNAAFNIYKFGKHSVVTSTGERKVLALRSLAVTTGRAIVPSFSIFESYYAQKGLDYADDLIRFVLKEPVSESSPAQRRSLVINTLKYEVMYFAALQKLYDAAAGCVSDDQTRFTKAKQEWDVGAAMIIGSTQSAGSSDNGDLMYKLAASLCPKFNTCDKNNKGEAKINEQIEEALYAGSYLLGSKQCKSVTGYASTIENLLKVPLIQSTLLYAVNNQNLPVGSSDPALAEGYIFSRSILPYIDAIDPDAAATINKNLNMQFIARPVIDGYKAVFDAFAVASSKTNNIDCRDIGYLESIGGVCPNGTGKGKSSATEQSPSFLITLGAMASLCLVFL